MSSVTLEEAQGRLAEILEALPPGEEVAITRDGKALATLKAAPAEPARKPRQLGTLRGTVLYIAPDFDDIPEGFEDYI